MSLCGDCCVLVQAAGIMTADYADKQAAGERPDAEKGQGELSYIIYVYTMGLSK